MTLTNASSRLSLFLLMIMVSLGVAACVGIPESLSTRQPGNAATGPEAAVSSGAAEPATDAADLLLTPAQAEGPYYPITEPVESDSDLTRVGGNAARPEGQVLLLSGRLLQEDATPVPGATVEIWQTDANGVYMHPGDPQFAERDPNFQFFGEALTDAGGRYAFRTVVPGLYGSRPQHIHVKVKLDGRELLTTQFYFADDARLEGSGLSPAIVVETEAGSDDAGNPVVLATKDIVLAGGD